MRESNSGSSGGVGFFGLLTILFIGLKLTDKIDWPWWVVLSPAWGSMAVLLFVIAIFIKFGK